MSSQGDGYESDIEPLERDRAECPACGGAGDVQVFVGPNAGLARCEDCGGMGYQLTRDEFAHLDALQGDRDLRLAPEPEGTPSFQSHGEEIAWHLSHRKAS